MPPLHDVLLLVPIGVCVGLVGSLIGVGGGFFVVPFLMLAFGYEPEEATATSLGIVFLSACSATFANVRRRRVDYRIGVALALGTLPGAWIGRLVIGGIKAPVFSMAFGVLLLAVATYLVFVKLKEGQGLWKGRSRELTDSDGQVYTYKTRSERAFVAGLGVGFVASLFGIGGGLLLVPFMVICFGMPILVATATAQFTFIATSLTGALVAAKIGQLTERGTWVILLMGVGVVVGAQVGVAVAKRFRPRWIRMILSTVLLAVAALMISQGF